MKKLTLAALVACFMLAACNKGTEPTAETSAPAETPTTQPAEQPATTEPQAQIQVDGAASIAATPADQAQPAAENQQAAAPAVSP